MKILNLIREDNAGTPTVDERGPAVSKRSEDGSATVLFTALLAIMMILFAANSKMIAHLHRDIRLIDQQQVKRLQAAPAHFITVTNSIAP